MGAHEEDVSRNRGEDSTRRTLGEVSKGSANMHKGTGSSGRRAPQGQLGVWQREQVGWGRTRGEGEDRMQGRATAISPPGTGLAARERRPKDRGQT